MIDFSFTTAVICITIIFITPYYIKRSVTGISEALAHIPSPLLSRYLPWIGSAIQFNPLYMHKWMCDRNRSKYGDNNTWWFLLAGMNMVVISNYNDIATVLTQSCESFIKSPVYNTTIGWWASDTVLLNSGDRWSNQRKLINPAFKHNRIISQHSITVQQTAHNIIERISITAEKSVDVYYLLSSAALDVLGITSFDVKFNTLTTSNKYWSAVQSVMKESYARLFRVSNMIQGRQSQHAAKKGLAVVDDAVHTMLQQRHTLNNTQLQQNSDVLSTMILEQRKGQVKLSDSDYIKQMRLLTVAGSDTTAAWMSSILYYLAKHSQYQNYLRTEIDQLYQAAQQQNLQMPNTIELLQLPYLQAVLHETLRLRPSIPIIDRQLSPAKKSFVLRSGFQLHHSMNVTVNLYALHHNKSIWGDDVDEFVPERWLDSNNQLISLKSPIKHTSPYSVEPSKITYSQAYMPFGIGKQSCPGKQLATMEASVLISHILHNFEFRLCDTKEPDFHYAISMIYPNGLNMSFTKLEQLWDKINICI